MKRLLFILLTFVSLSMAAQTVSVKEKAAVRQQYINFCKELNQQLPAQVDEITTLNSIAFMNWTMTATYSVDIDSNDVSSEDMAMFKSAMQCTMLSRKWQVRCSLAVLIKYLVLSLRH